MSFGNPKQTIKVVDNYEVQQEKTNETYKMKSPTLIVQKSSLSHIQKAGQLSWYKSEKVSKTPNWLKKLQEYYLTISNHSIRISTQLEVTGLWTIRNRNRNGWYSTCFQCAQRKTGNKKQTWKEIFIFPKVGCWYLFAQIATDVSAFVIVCTFSRYEINPRNWPSTYLQYLDWLCTKAVVYPPMINYKRKWCLLLLPKMYWSVSSNTGQCKRSTWCCCANYEVNMNPPPLLGLSPSRSCAFYWGAC